MRPLRVILNLAGLVLFPAFLAGAATFAAIDHVARWLERGHDQLDHEITGDIDSWLAARGEPA